MTYIAMKVNIKRR